VGVLNFKQLRDLAKILAVDVFPEGKVRQNWTTFSSPGFGIANFSFLAGKTSYLLITKLGLLTIKMLVLPRLSNFVQFHWTPVPRLPDKRKAPGSLLEITKLVRVRAIKGCPTICSKLWGRYFKCQGMNVMGDLIKTDIPQGAKCASI
jgi:hypothetical protein